MQLTRSIQRSRSTHAATALANADWLESHMSPYFFQAMADESEALTTLARELGTLQHNRHLMLSDRERTLILACVDQPGSLYETLRRIPVEHISYAMFSHSNGAMPGMTEELEVQRFEFDRRPHGTIDPQREPELDPKLQRSILRELRTIAPSLDRQRCLRLLSLLWQNNPASVTLSPPSRTAWLVWLFSQSNASGGLYLDLREVEREGQQETRLLFAVGNPPQEEFLLQVVEVFNRLDIGIRRAYCQTISNGTHPYFLGTFYLQHRSGQPLTTGSPLAGRMQQELCNTQILANTGYSYREWVTKGVLPGDDAALINAFVAFCHTNLAHSNPDRFGLEDVQSAFHNHPEMALLLTSLFRLRFDPELPDRQQYQQALAEVTRTVQDYNTGHRWLDEIRRTIYRCCLLLISHTLKTNFFVVEKQALAFRLDPAYLQELGSATIADLPDTPPFRVTFFFSRYGHGYHIGFSDIARGGWRTIIARNQDDMITAASTLLREVYVLAHTQHLKNKDIYEGGSKLALVLDASDLDPAVRDAETCRLYKLQYSIANAFLDIFITSDGRARDQRVVDYYGDDEPIELGPDENMHDSMIEALADLSRRRGYLLGAGIISSKRFGINHKQYGVTSTGVMTFAEVVMAAHGIDIRHDPFSVKLTGGPGGDVAGNCLRLILERCPQARLTMILDGTAAAYDPAGLDRDELQRITLRQDLDHFDPRRLGPGGLMLFRSGQRKEGLKQVHRRMECLPDGSLQERWIPADDFHREYDKLLFHVATDLFIPAGGRPETIDDRNWSDFLLADGRPSAPVIVEGANSFITPQARLELQKAGCVIMRDASANKCGVISSSYEIIANLLLTEQEFQTFKERYVADVLAILEKRSRDEARLILQRRQESGGNLPYTEVSSHISQNINSYYGRLFQFFSQRPQLCLQRPFRGALLRHLPALLREEPAFRRRISRLPRKYQAAILAAEIGASLVYTGNRDADFEQMVRRHLQRIDSV
ncbi:MAG: NAD-glutamate dehydrogenase domain-containing protein [Geobacter sp.]